MSKLRTLALLVPLALALGACGNKGDLVKPIPSKLPPPATPDSGQQPAATPTAPAPSAPAPAHDDSGGH
jgi:predicted small lipoprotein YifL